MPGGNGRGPMGEGPMTGRGMGYCSGGDIPTLGTMAGRRGFGMPLGRGRRGGRWAGGAPGGVAWRPGWAAWGDYPDYAQSASPELERTSLKNQADLLEAELKRIRQRLADMEGGNSEA